MVESGLAGGFEALVGVDGEDHEGLVLVALGQLALGGNGRQAGTAAGGPEDEKDDLAPVVGQLHRLAAEVFAFDLGRGLADGDVVDVVEPFLGYPASDFGVGFLTTFVPSYFQGSKGTSAYSAITRL